MMPMEYDDLNHKLMLYIHHQRISDHGGRDRSSQMYKHSIEKDHPTEKVEDSEILGKGFR